MFALPRMATEFWNEIPRHFPDVALDAFAVMPNHIHGILYVGIVGAKNFSPLLLLFSALLARANTCSPRFRRGKGLTFAL